MGLVVRLRFCLNWRNFVHWPSPLPCFPASAVLGEELGAMGVSPGWFCSVLQNRRVLLSIQHTGEVLPCTQPSTGHSKCWNGNIRVSLSFPGAPCPQPMDMWLKSLHKQTQAGPSTLLIQIFWREMERLSTSGWCSRFALWSPDLVYIQGVMTVDYIKRNLQVHRQVHSKINISIKQKWNRNLKWQMELKP